MQNLQSKSGLKQLFWGQRVLKLHVQYTRNPMEQSNLSKNLINPKRNIFFETPCMFDVHLDSNIIPNIQSVHPVFLIFMDAEYIIHNFENDQRTFPDF